MKTLTECQKETLNYISQFTEENDFPPTVREMSEKFNISLRAANCPLNGCSKLDIYHNVKKELVQLGLFQIAEKKKTNFLLAKFLCWEQLLLENLC